MRLTAVSREAASEGLVPGITVAEARALVPNLTVGDADPVGDAADLHRLASWCQRWTPRVAADGEDGLLLDITGCGHLFGGDGSLLSDIAACFTRAGIGHRLGAAPTPVAAWAWSHYRRPKTSPILGHENLGEAARPLPVEALRVSMELATALDRVGLRTVGDLLRVPRAPLTARFGVGLIDRLDRLLGAVSDPITPLGVPPAWSTRLTLTEPICRREDFEAATGRLLADLTESLLASGRGARTLVLSLLRVDGTMQTLEIGTAKPSRDARHLLRLFRERFDRIEPGFGVETLILEATETNPLPSEQTEIGGSGTDSHLSDVIDRLRTRAGRAAALRLAIRDTHVPERAIRLQSIGEESETTAWQTDGERPVVLLSPPEPINTDLPDDRVPDAFYWRGRRYHVGLIEGPERIRSEWWRDRDAVRDYYRVQEIGGRRFWIFHRRGASLDGWFLHGLFA